MKLSAAALVLASLSPPQDALQTQSFSIPDTRATRALADSVQGHIAARRWSDALRALQQTLEEHRGDVLAPERPQGTNGRVSEQPVHPGAAQRARATLWALPLEARRLYRERHESEARAAFERARDRGDRTALTEVARRWPLTESAERAWWSLGDVELELGNSRAAIDAWGRAVAAALSVNELALDTVVDWEAARTRLSQRDPPPSPGVEARVLCALRLLSASDGGIAADDGARADAGDAHLRATPPGRDADAWSSPFALPDHPFKRPGGLYPVRSGDTLLVSTSLRLLALHAYSGALLWDSGEPDGWEVYDDARRVELWEGVDDENGIVAPAASAHVAVCALHIPMSVPPKVDRTFQNIKILTPIPERRLYAFDLDTGRELWNHHPPATWDGESGSFTDRMSVAGPPVIAGTRVLVPYRRMQGRIDFHVGCIDIDTGEVMWSTDLISGQRELNMFGRPVKEFSAPPLVVAGNRVIALTQLGAIAALDLFTGEILWETVYDQIPLPKAHDFTAPRREQCWRNGAPVVQGDTIVAAPVDSRDLIGVDLATGGLIWSLSKSLIDGFARGRNDSQKYALLGAQDDVVYVSGNQILALQSRGGLHQNAPISLKWSFEDDLLRNHEPVRGVLTADRILIPTSSERIEIELSQGLKIADWPWTEDEGGANLMLGPGELFTVSAARVNGYFEWDVLVDRARREQGRRPQDPRLALALGELLCSRGTAQWQKGKTESARSVLAEARDVLEHGLANDPAALSAPLSAALHSVLRSEARVRKDLADSAGALHALRQARAYAPDTAALRDTLLDEVALLEERTSEGVEDALALLERSCADLPIACTITPVAPAGDAADTAQTGEVILPRFVPLPVASLENGDSRCEIPVGLWVLFERASLARAAGNTTAEFTALHALLERYPDVELSAGNAGELASERIGSMLRSGRSSGYDAFESRAKAQLDTALASRDRQKLVDVARLFPHSRASQTANDALLDWATESLEVERVAKIVRSELASDWDPRSASPRDVQLCLRLASVAAAVGNRELGNELVRTLAEDHPDVVSELPAHRGRRLADIASGIARWTPPDVLPPVGRFDAGVRSIDLDASWDADHDILGALPAEPDERGQRERPLLVVRTSSGPQTATFLALSPKDPSRPLWTTAIKMSSLPSGSTSGGWSRRVALSGTRVIVTTGESIVALDSETGATAWEWRPASPPRSTSVSVASGVLIAVLRLADERYVLQALDAHGGHELWREDLLDTSLLRIPVLSSNRLVFLPALSRAQCVTYDLFTGRRGISFKLDPAAGSNMERDAWIEGDRLVLPWLNATRANLSSSNLVQAIDLATGTRLWKVAFADSGTDPRTLDGVLQFGDRTFLVVRPWRGNDDKPTAPGLILELSTQIGATAPISNVRVMPEDRIFGLASSSRVRLQSSLVFILAERRDAETSSLRCVDLSSGELWIQSLAVPASELEYNLPMPLPAISDTTVAVGFTRRPRDRQAPPTTLLFYDRATGIKRDERTLVLPLARSDRAQFVAFADALLIKGGRRLEILR